MCFTSGNYSLGGGRTGFCYGTSSQVRIDEYKLRIDGDDDGTFDDGADTVDVWDGFTINASDQAEETLTHDAAGNLIYDDCYQFTYDAWKRLVKVQRAYRTSGGTLTATSTVATMRYDGTGRRTVKAVANSPFLLDLRGFGR